VGGKAIKVSEEVYYRLRELAERHGFSTMSDVVEWLLDGHQEGNLHGNHSVRGVENTVEKRLAGKCGCKLDVSDFFVSWLRSVQAQLVEAGVKAGVVGFDYLINELGPEGILDAMAYGFTTIKASQDYLLHIITEGLKGLWEQARKMKP
jgi:predicted CopG family antitoxin